MNAAPEAGELFGLRVPFAKLLGLNAEAMEGGRSRLSLELRDELQNTWGAGHGGVLMTMLDISMAMAARSVLPPGAGIVTVELSSQFHQAAHGRLVAEGQVMRAGGQILFCRATACNASGETVATGLGSFLRRNAQQTSRTVQPS